MKQIVVVGGSGGLGNALVTALLDQHYQVVVAGRKAAADPRVATFCAIDATSVDWPSLYRTIEQNTGAAIDAIIFVSGAAVFGRTASIPAARARQTLELNFWACTAAAQAAAEHWSKQHRAGKFLAILSIVARHGVPFEAHYSASKAATARFLECLQLEYGSRNIEFISAFPGMLNTPFRSRAEWYGLEPSRCEGGADPTTTAETVIVLLKGQRKARVIGWRERIIDLSDRIWPGLYDRVVLQARVRKLLEPQEPRAREPLQPQQQEPHAGGSSHS